MANKYRDVPVVENAEEEDEHLFRNNLTGIVKQRLDREQKTEQKQRKLSLSDDSFTSDSDFITSMSGTSLSLLVATPSELQEDYCHCVIKRILIDQKTGRQSCAKCDQLIRAAGKKDKIKAMSKGIPDYRL